MDQSDLEILQSIFSDAHKDARGYRPRWPSREQWRDPVWLQDRILEYGHEIRFHDEVVDLKQNAAKEKFENQIAELVLSGANDRATAIRWLMEGSGAEDTEHLCWMMDLPYGYLANEKADQDTRVELIQHDSEIVCP